MEEPLGSSESMMPPRAKRGGSPAALEKALRIEERSRSLGSAAIGKDKQLTSGRETRTNICRWPKIKMVSGKRGKHSKVLEEAMLRFYIPYVFSGEWGPCSHFYQGMLVAT